MGLGIAAILFFPIVLGPLAMILGAVGWSRGERQGPIGVVVGLIGLLVGMVLGAIIGANSFS
jgi:hypothetical protein